MASILVVEDQRVVAWDIQEALENLGHTVIASVTSGVAAIQVLAISKPDLILMDIQLEGDIDGVETAEKIYESLKIPIVYLTAHADEHTLQRATSTATFGYLVKPFQQKELHTTIQVALHRHQLEQSLTATQQWFATTLASIANPTIATDKNGSITFINPVAEALTGWQWQDALGKDVSKVFDIVYEQTRETLENPGMQAMRLGSPVTLPERCLLLTKNSKETHISNTAAPIKDKQGEIIGSVMIFQEITEPQQFQADLQQRNMILEEFQLNLISRLQNQTTQLQQAIASIQVLKHVIEQVRNTLDERQILQMALQELGLVLEADYCWIALHDPRHEIATITCEYISSDTEHQHSGLGTQIDVQSCPRFYLRLFQHENWLSPDPKILPTPYQNFVLPKKHVLICPIYDQEQVMGEIGILTTEQRFWSYIQIELVSQVVNQCAIALRQTRLHQAAQSNTVELERLNYLKDDFISSVSHELRTPLINMRMAMEHIYRHLCTLKSADLNSAPSPNKQLLRQELELYLQIFQEEWQQEFNLINDLLNFQSPAIPAAPLPVNPIELQQWLPQVIARFAAQATKQRQILSYQLSPQLPTLTSHLPTLERIVTELLSNACKYTPPTKKITVSVQTQEERLKFKFTNTGIEIPSEELELIFQPFYRIPRPNSWNHGGTGLGLALVKKLVLHLGGDVQVESRNKATTFTITLPVVQHKTETPQ